MSERAARSETRFPSRKARVLDQRDWQLAPRHLGGHLVEPETADDDDAARAGRFSEAHGVHQQRLRRPPR